MTKKVNNNKKTGDTLTANEWNELADAVNVIGGEIKDFYKVPEGGIPKEDLNEEIQNSLDKANTALQEQDISSKVDKPSNTPTINNFMSFDKDGNALDSGCNADSFAPKANAMPLPTEQDEGKILGYEAPMEGANPIVGWVDKPVDGKSALDIYNDINPEAQLDEAGFIAKLQQKYPMKHAAYYSGSVSQAIGTPFTGALDNDELLPTSDTMGNLYIMPNSDTTPTGSIAFTTINTGEDTYAWVSLGAVDIPDNALTEDDVDDDCIDGLATKPASAKVVSDLKYRLYGEGGTVNRVLIEDNPGTGENLCTSKWIICKEDNTNLVTTPSHMAVRWYSGGYASYSINLSEYGNAKKLHVISNGVNYVCITFLKKSFGSIDGSALSFTLQQLTENDVLSEVHYNSSTGTWKNALFISPNNGDLQEIDIPEDAKYVYIAGRCWDLSKSAFEGTGRYDKRIPSYLEIEYEVEDAENSDIGLINTKIASIEDGLQGLSHNAEIVNNDIYGIPTGIRYDIDVSTVVTEKISLDGNGNIYTRYKSDTIGQDCYKIKVDDVDYIHVVPNQSYKTILFISKNELKRNQIYKGSAQLADETSDDGYILDSSGYRMTISNSDTDGVDIKIADNAKFLYIQKCYSNTSEDRTPSSIVLVKDENVGGIINDVNKLKESGGGTITTKNIHLFQGYLNSYGKLVYDEFHATTGFLSLGTGFLVTLRNGLQVQSAMLYDIDGNLLNSEFYAYKARFTGGWGCAKMLPQFLVRLVIGNDDDTEIGSLSNVIADFILLDDKRLVRFIPENKKFKEMHIRLNQLENPVWNNEAKLAYIIDSKYNPATWIGIPYSETSEFTKYVGNHVMLKTFLTAVKNKRSVLYTEHINQQNGSQYGFTYHGLSDLSGTFFGTVCSGLTSYVRNKKNVLMEDGNIIAYGEYKISTGETSIHITGSGNAQDSIDDLFNIIEPLDVIWNTGHVTIVSDVYKDEFGDKKIIVISEQTTPLGFSTPFTKEMLLNRLNVTVNETESGSHKEWNIRRYDDWNTLTSPLEDTSEYIQNEWMRYTPEELEIDSDISTFCGEYATFCINGDEDSSEEYNNYKAFLNIHRGVNLYDTLEIYSDNDTLIDTYSIASNDNDIIKQSNIYSNDAANKEDWIIFDLSKIGLSAGKYKARLKNSTDSISSGYTHFEMVQVSLEVNKADNGGYDIAYNSDGGVPYLIRQERLNGLMPSSYTDRVIELDEQEPTTYVDWTKLSNAPYIKLFVRGEYGVVVKRVEMPDA